MGELDSTVIDAIYDAALKSFWRKNALSRFLRRHGVPPALGQPNLGLSKREMLDEVFSALVNTAAGQRAIVAMGQDLANRTEFPDLHGYEESERMLAQAHAAIALLKTVIGAVHEAEIERRRRSDSWQSAEARAVTYQRAQRDLEQLNVRLAQLTKELGTAQAGYSFEDWFYDFSDHFEIEGRRPYVTGGRQIDGSLTIAGTTYLVELKFTRGQTGVGPVDSLRAKVHTKADNTMGIFVSMAGYTPDAIRAASGARTTLLLFDYSHIMHCLGGLTSLGDLIERVRRHASQTGEAYLSLALMGA